MVPVGGSRSLVPAMPSGGGKEPKTMPVPVPRQRAIPAVESGQAQAAPAVGGPSREEAARHEEALRGEVALREEEALREEATAAENDGPLNATPADGVHHGVSTTGVSAKNVSTEGVSNENVSTKGVTSQGTAATPTAHTTLTLLMIEDDPTAAPIVHDLRDSDGKPIRVRTARNLTEAERLLTDDVHCILLDLALPAPGRAKEADDELAVLRHVLR